MRELPLGDARDRAGGHELEVALVVVVAALKRLADRGGKVNCHGSACDT